MTLQQYQLTGRALRFLQLMQDFGHVEDVSRIVLDLPRFGFPDDNGVYDLDTVKRAVASAILEERPEGVSGLLAQDWPLLFS